MPEALTTVPGALGVDAVMSVTWNLSVILYSLTMIQFYGHLRSSPVSSD